ncbi:hydroxyacylglutathione hydrolase [Pseudomonas sp. M47T1]|uniref:hydroxyacylglutathione hydrolase n=1 Tax=Pseudomonas sp. M47T1 TaxID=1179778 RepID=UPI000260731D|nr:hydroxyacylglutathione hydrolase [Pseudomonas sp. M47T1]EIK94387.1 hydroxyacylglutathione hydrolase [Pseudomonas sp. M47T1]
MKVIRHYVGNDLRNFNYVVGCDRTGQAIVIDPFDHRAVLQIAVEMGWQIKLILNTHEHYDHIEGNPFVQQVTGAEIWAHRGIASVIPNVAKGLVANEIIELGDIRLKVFFTPGHTAAHVCFLLLPPTDKEAACFFSGDTLFNASAGNCRNGGNVDDLYHTFVSVIGPLADNTLLYPGHDYLLNNLNFALECDPSNLLAQRLKEQICHLQAGTVPVMTLGDERAYNPFLRLGEAKILEKMRPRFAGHSPRPSQVFARLGELRDNW